MEDTKTEEGILNQQLSARPEAAVPIPVLRQSLCALLAVWAGGWALKI